MLALLFDGVVVVGVSSCRRFVVDLDLVRLGVDRDVSVVDDNPFNESMFSRLELREIDETSPV